MPQRQDDPSFDPTSSQSVRTVMRAPAAPGGNESTETRQVLMHRVISLNGAPESAAAANKPKPVKVNSDIDLSRTVHEWGVQNPSASAPHLTESIELAASSQSQPAHNIQARVASLASVEARWATYSSISLEVFEETPLPPRILNANIEDAVTQQYEPAMASRAMAFATSSSDLARLDRALESAGVLDDDHEFGVITNYQPTTTPEPIPAAPPARAQPPQLELQPLQPQPQQPRMLLVPASIVWTVLTVFLLCLLALTVLTVAAVLRGQLF